MAERLADPIRADAQDIKAAGEIIEEAVREFFQRRLFPKYHVSDGHILDHDLTVSPQYDLIISESSHNPVFFPLADGTEFVYYEPVRCFAEIKKSYYSKDILKKFSENLVRFKSNMVRENLDPRAFDAGNTGVLAELPLTNLPLRNPLITFLFVLNSRELNLTEIGKFLTNTPDMGLPNFIVLLDLGIIVNVNVKGLEENKLQINLYPEYQIDKSEGVWVLLAFNDDHDVLLYQYLLVTEHLNSTTSTKPDLMKYGQNLLGFSYNDIHRL